MNECPYHKVRSDLPPLTERISKLPVDARGYPVPFFVQWLQLEAVDEKQVAARPGDPNSYPEFRLADPIAWRRCVEERLCWVCGERLGKLLTFVVGPMCCINRTSAEPPSHYECGEWSTRGCPFLSKPKMVRREDDLTRANEENVPGEMIKRNPGVMVLWTTTSYKVFADGRGGALVELGDPVQVAFLREGRGATTDEIMHSIDTGIDKLLDACENDADRLELGNRVNAFSKFVREGNPALLSTKKSEVKLSFP